ncbi:protein of unknown function DUF447 [Methanobacterium lacus]|uniref:DUF447 family protein n=1 Tax=Methanobacterium lacus (strain AL-21) TaxID=877455 RepID=F0T658_METLA|nr:DUF447 domain-containing protein [Methanobacterium lacus]ADZ10565.1 protein of unknown function DUF447 [Methanobacterium lacus]
MDLKDIGMERGLLYETVVTTVDSNGKPNAAPIGIICKNNLEVVCYLHHGSTTVKNIKDTKSFVVNVLKDPMIFVESTLGNLPIEKYESHGDKFYIGSTDAFFVADVTSIKDVERKDQFGVSVTSVLKADVSDITKFKQCVEPLNRAIYGIVEGLVYLTRMNMVSGDMEKLYRHRMAEIARIVSKVGAKDHKNAMDMIMEAFKDFD